ncbi:MAG: hypothetical protein ACYDHP_08660 [Ferrimicrobium sp.]
MDQTLAIVSVASGLGGLLIAGGTIGWLILHPSRSHNRWSRLGVTIATWSAVVGILLGPTIIVASDMTLPLPIKGYALVMIGLNAILALAITLAALDEEIRRKKTWTIIAYISWAILTTVMLDDVWSFAPLATFGITAIALLEAVIPATVLLKLDQINLSHLRPRSAVVALVVTGVALSIWHQSTSVTVVRVPTKDHPIVAVDAAAHDHLDLDHLSAGVITSGLGQRDQPLSFTMSGRIIASKPNFHQIVRLIIEAQLGSVRSQRLKIIAAGVPQPNGSLSLTTSRVLVGINQLHIDARGRARRVLAQAVFGQLRYRNTAYAFLLTYSPVDYHLIRGVFTMWPASVSSTPVATFS